MKKSRYYTDEQHEFLLKHYKGTRPKDLCQMFNERFNENKSVTAIKSYLTNRGLKTGTPRGVKGSKLFSKEQVQFIHDHVQGKTNQELTDMFNKEFGTSFTKTQIKRFKGNNNISSGLTGYFEKGHAPMNKGKTWDEFMSPEAQARSRKTTFQKGQTPLNIRPIGSKFIDKDGYLRIKVSETGHRHTDWPHAHRLEWEKHNGPIPKGHVVTFLDSDKTNIAIDNLELVSQSIMLIKARNELHIKGDAELNKAATTIAKIYEKVSKVKQGEMNND